MGAIGPGQLASEACASGMESKDAFLRRIHDGITEHRMLVIFVVINTHAVRIWNI
jgi:hypothetical protein